MTENYQALGEHTAYIEQAKDAAQRRFGALYNAAHQLRQRAERVEDPLDVQTLKDMLDACAAADREMRAALERANQAGALCGRPEVKLSYLNREWRDLPR